MTKKEDLTKSLGEAGDKFSQSFFGGEIEPESGRRPSAKGMAKNSQWETLQIVGKI